MKQPERRVRRLMNCPAEWITTPDNAADRDSPLSIGRGRNWRGGRKNKGGDEEINQRAKTVLIMEAG